MSAHAIFDNAPIGSIIAWSDGTPRPHERFAQKRADWQTRNGTGRLIRKQPSRSMGNLSLTASFTLHQADRRAVDVSAIRFDRIFSLDSSLQFTVIERPAIGAVRLFDRAGSDAELVYLAPHRQAAEEWLARHGYPQAVLDEVTADEVGASIVEGRAT
jgi:hypothetical protein